MRSTKILTTSMMNFSSKSVSRAGRHPSMRKEKSSLATRRIITNLRKMKLQRGGA